VTRDERDHLRGIVAIWMTNGNNPVDGGNDTRYDFFRGGWMEAAEATGFLAQNGYVTAPESGDHGEIDVSQVTPTAKGIYEAMA
jgi:hypothetical protein